MAETRRKEEKGKKEPRSKARALRPGERVDKKGKARGLLPGELMIGDLVWSEITGRLAKVVALDEGAAVVGTMSEAFIVPADEVRAVAITGDVLGLLGFEENRVIGGLYYLEEPTEVNVGDLYDGRWSVDAYECDSLNKVMEGHVVRYVHELQHVLRVMGVESEPRWNLGVKDGTEN